MTPNTTLKIGILVPMMKHLSELTPDFKGKIESEVNDYIIKKFNKYGEIVYPGLVRSIEDGKKAEQEFLSKDVDIIISVGMVYATSDITFSAIQNIKTPIILLNTSTKKTIPNDYSLTDAAKEQYVLTSVEIASVLKREDKKHFYIVSGLVDDENMHEKVAGYLKAAQIIKKLKNSNIGFIGGSTFPGMMDIIVDEVAVKNKFGASIIHFSNDEIASTFKSISKDQIEEEKKKMLSEYTNISINKNEESFNKSIQMGLCFKSLIDKYNLVSVANYCYPSMRNPEINVPACMGSVMCSTDGVPFSCEADIGNAIALYILKELAGASAHVEFSLSDYEKNAILMFHCGNGNLRLSRGPDDVEIKFHQSFKEETCTVDNSSEGTSFEFSARDGKATLLSISTDKDSQWQINICSGEIKYYDPVNLSIPQSWWKVSGSIDDFIEKWCAAGPTHHMALGYGHQESILAKISLLLDLKCYIFE